MSNRNQIDNNIFGNLNRDEMRRLEAKVIQAPKIRLCSTYLTPSREIVPIAEALVAFDTATNQIVKFVAGFIPGNEFGAHIGKKYLISRKNIHGRHNPVCVKRGETVGDLKKFWNDQMLITHLDHDKLPWSCATAEYRVLRAYRQDIRAKARFELLTFHTPTTGDVDKRTMQPIWRGNNPPFALDKYVKGFFWWTQSLLSEISAFSGVDLMSHLTIHNKVVKEESPEMAAEMLHDHSEDTLLSEPEDGPNIVSADTIVQPVAKATSEEEAASEDEIDLGAYTDAKVTA